LYAHMNNKTNKQTKEICLLNYNKLEHKA
jgi:hypothetical protein